MEKEKEGFPVTALREVRGRPCSLGAAPPHLNGGRQVNTLLKARHENIVNVQEIVVGSVMDSIFIVMEFVEHDLKGLLETMPQPFLPAEVKTLMRQLLSGVHHLHDNWILHRDLKTSNLLMSHSGILKIADFGEPPAAFPCLHRRHPLMRPAQGWRASTARRSRGIRSWW